MSKSSKGEEKDWTQWLFYIVIVSLLVGVALGPVAGWLNRARKHSLRAGLKNIRDAYTAYYSTKSAYPGPELKELLVQNGGTIAEWPVDPVSGTGMVVTSLTGSGGWLHDMEKHEVKVNIVGDDPFGQRYSEY